LGELKAAIANPAGDRDEKSFQIDYGPLEASIATLSESLKGLELGCPPRWLALKLLESDSEAPKYLTKKAPAQAPGLLAEAQALREDFEKNQKLSAERHLAFSRHQKASELAKAFQTVAEPGRKTLSDKIDQIVCHRIFGPLILLGVLFSLYQISIVYGGALATKIWPLWAKGQDIFLGLLPSQGFLTDPIAYSLGAWVARSLAAILNYLPIFLLLFALIAILEDSGYMPRMAFLLDRLFRRFGLHGQSTLPLILGGVYVGGCAIPAVMATRAIPDERARLATILIAPMMNCLAKVPLYLILIGAFFSASPLQSSLAMFFVATVTLLMALPVARLLTLTALRSKTSAPFILELPPYHAPGARTILIRTIERTWLFLKKIVTVVLAVAIVVFALINYPSLDAKRFSDYEAKADSVRGGLLESLKGSPLEGQVSFDDVGALILFEDELKMAKRGVTEQEKADKIEAEFAQMDSRLYGLLKGSGPGYAELKKGLRKVASERKKLRRDLKEESFKDSVLGVFGRALEPLTKFAGFDWRINIALLSAFAAKENSAATLGAIYGLQGEGDDVSPAEALKESPGGFGPLHALALMIFMALYPPCVPTSIMVRLQANSTGWMIFAVAWQALLGLLAAVLVYTGGRALGLSGWGAMWSFYALCLIATVVAGLIPEKRVSPWPKASRA
jgi:ferrous iron transport protein B